MQNKIENPGNDIIKFRNYLQIRVYVYGYLKKKRLQSTGGMGSCEREGSRIIFEFSKKEIRTFFTKRLQPL